MNLAEQIKSLFPNLVIETSDQRGDTVVTVKKEAIKEIAFSLKQTPELGFNLLMDLFAVDYLHWEEKACRFEVVYNLFSVEKNRRVFIKIRVSEEDTKVDSVAAIWPAANWYEREVW